jgi:hypothetical protein
MIVNTVEQNRKIIAQQTRKLYSAGANRIFVDCGSCGITISILFSCRCLECGIWFCQRCAKDHFKIDEVSK